MYLYGAKDATTVDGKTPKLASSLSSRVIGRELTSSTLYKRQQKDTTSSKLQVKGPKMAEALQVAELYQLRQQLRALPSEIKEDARVNYLLNQSNQQRDLQDFQCRMLAKVEQLLKQRMIENGEDIYKFRIGGHDDATYERFFRIEPSRYMSKPQFSTALRLVFGEEMIKSSTVANKLFDSFDLRRVDQMDWRSMLFLLALVMQPTLPFLEIIKVGYSLYSSVGSFDLTCIERLPLGVLKDLIATPAQLSMRPTLYQEFDQAWQHLMQHDEQIILFSAKTAAKRRKLDGSGTDPNEFKIPFKFFMKMLQETPLSKYIAVAKVFGKYDPRPWTYHLEEHFYHPILLDRIKTLRRDYRNEEEVVKFRAQRDIRKKRFSHATWVEYVKKRILLRSVLIAAEIRATIANYYVYVAHLRKVCIEYRAAIAMQRIIRGFTVRRRRQFMKRLQKKVVKMQSYTRQYLQRLSYSRQKMRFYWAAVTIQRIIRGRRARRRVAIMVEEYYDRESRRLARDKAQWMLERHVRAMMCIKRYWKKYLRRKAKLRELALREMEEDVAEEMRQVEEMARIAWEVYKQNLSKWYEERKIAYDSQVLTELHTKAQKKLLVERRARAATEAKLRKKMEHEFQLQRAEEERVEYWLRDWEEKIIKRGEERRKMCRNALKLPETPEEVQLKKDMAKRIKAHIKDVLRKADLQKIPMEIPQAYEISTEEIIEEEVQSALAQARQEMKDEGERLEAEKARKEEQQRLEEIAEKKRKAKWAVVTIQVYARIFLSRRRVRQKAYARYKKLFDVAYHEYYYQDKVTLQCFWEKPKSLGSYDLLMEDAWIVLPVRRADDTSTPEGSIMPLAPASSGNSGGIEATFEKVYYYHPASWRQTWIQPEYTVMCTTCNLALAQHYLLLDYQCYCTACLSNKVYTELTVGDNAMHQRDIKFQLFNGGRPDASYMDMDPLPITDWYAFVMKLDPSLQMTEEEEEEEARRAKILKRKKRLSQELHYCLECKAQIAVLFCPDCPKHHCIYCNECDSHVHRKGQRKLHRRQKLLIDQARNASQAAHNEKNSLHLPALSAMRKTGKSMMSLFQSKVFGQKEDSDEDSSDEDQSRKKKTGSFFLPPINGQGGSSQRLLLGNGDDAAASGTQAGYVSSSSASSSSSGDRRKRQAEKKRKKSKKRVKKPINEVEGDDSPHDREGVEESDKEKRKKKKKSLKARKDKSGGLSETDMSTTAGEEMEGELDPSPTKRKKAKNKIRNATVDGTDVSSRRSQTAPSSKEKAGSLLEEETRPTSTDSPLNRKKLKDKSPEKGTSKTGAKKKQKKVSKYGSRGSYGDDASTARVDKEQKRDHYEAGDESASAYATDHTADDEPFDGNQFEREASQRRKKSSESPPSSSQSKRRKKRASNVDSSPRKDEQISDNYATVDDLGTEMVKNKSPKKKKEKTKARKSSIADLLPTSDSEAPIVQESDGGALTDDGDGKPISPTKRKAKKTGKKDRKERKKTAVKESEDSEGNEDSMGVVDRQRDGRENTAESEEEDAKLDSSKKKFPGENFIDDFDFAPNNAPIGKEGSEVVGEQMPVQTSPKKKKKKKSKAVSASMTDESDGANTEYTSDGTEVKKAKKKKTKMQDAHVTGDGEESLKPKTKKKKKVISGVLAGLRDAGGLLSESENDATAASTGSQTAKKKKKKKKVKKTTVEVDDMMNVAAGYETENPEGGTRMKGRKGKKTDSEDEGYSSSAATPTKKKKKAKRPDSQESTPKKSAKKKKKKTSGGLNDSGFSDMSGLSESGYETGSTYASASTAGGSKTKRKKKKKKTGDMGVSSGSEVDEFGERRKKKGKKKKKAIPSEDF